MTIKCLGKGPRDISINGTGMFHMPSNCSGHAAGIVMPRSFKAHTSLNVHHERLRIPDIKIPKWNLPEVTYFRKMNTSTFLKGLKVHTLKEVKYLGKSITQLQDDYKNEEKLMALRDTVSILGNHNTGTWSTIGIIIAVIVSCGIMYSIVKVNHHRRQGQNDKVTGTNITMEIPLVKAQKETEKDSPTIRTKQDKALRTTVKNELDNIISKN